METFGLKPKLLGLFLYLLDNPYTGKKKHKIKGSLFLKVQMGKKVIMSKINDFKTSVFLIWVSVWLFSLPSFSAPNLEDLAYYLKSYPQARVGIYIGTFDPPHMGHLKVAREAIAQGLVDVVLWLPNDNAHHKPNATPFYLRHVFSERLLAKENRIFLPSRYLLPNKEGYVKDSLSWLERQLVKPVHWIGMLGTDIAGLARDIFSDQIHWMGRSRSFLVNLREGWKETELPKEIEGRPVQTFVSQDGGLSSTQIREWVKKQEREALKKALSPQVTELIFDYHLWNPNLKSCRLIWIP